MSMPSSPGSLGPRLNRGYNEHVLLSWMEPGETATTLRVSELGASGWQAAHEVISDAKMFVNWADLPSIMSISDDHWVAHWLSYSANETYSYDISFAQSRDAGKTWSPPIAPHTDGTTTEHGFVSIWHGSSVGTDAAGLIWLDGRHMDGAANDGIAPAGMTLRAAFVDATGELTDEQEIDGLVCDCCQTDVAVSSRGPIAVYRDRSREEIRDISLSRYVNGGWQTGEPFSNDNWKIDACPVNGPAISAAGDLVAVAWFTVADEKPRVQIRISGNGGNQFGDAVIVADNNVLGHVDIAYIGDSSFAVSWLQNSSDLNDINVRSVTADGVLGSIKTVGRTAIARIVPQMIEHRGRLYFVWTDTLNDQSHLAGVSAEIVLAKKRSILPLKLWW